MSSFNSFGCMICNGKHSTWTISCFDCHIYVSEVLMLIIIRPTLFSQLLIPGRYSFMWLRAFNNHDDLFSTCFEVDIVSNQLERNRVLQVGIDLWT